MKRYGMIVGLKPDRIEEYKRLHTAVWPDVLKMIAECSIRNYSIYFRRLPDGNHYLFSYFEYTGADFAADMARTAEVTLNLPHSEAALENLMGGRRQPLKGGPGYRFPVRPQQIVTLRFRTDVAVPDVNPLTNWEPLVPQAKRAALNTKLDKKGHPPAGAQNGGTPPKLPADAARTVGRNWLSMATPGRAGPRTQGSSRLGWPWIWAGYAPSSEPISARRTAASSNSSCRSTDFGPFPTTNYNAQAAPPNTIQNGPIFLSRRLQRDYNQKSRYLPIQQKYSCHKTFNIRALQKQQNL